MEGQNTDGVRKDVEKLVEFVWFSLCFYFAGSPLQRGITGAYKVVI